MGTGDICRMCLDIDVLMFSISGTPLQSVYEKLTNKPLETGTKPVTACYVCYAQLIRSHNFMLTCCIAENVIMEILQENPMVTRKSVALIDRKSKGLQASLMITPVDIDSLPVTQILNNRPYAPVQSPTVPTNVPLDPLTVPVNCPIIPIHYVDIPDNPQSVYEQIHITEEQRIHDSIPVLSPERVYEQIRIKDEPPDPLEMDSEDDDNFQMQTQEKLPVEGGVNISETQKEDGDSSDIQIRNDLNNNGDLSIVYECNICQARFMGVINFQVHLVTHQDEKPYECGICRRSFDRKSMLTSHLRTHSGEKPYKCQRCKKSFIHTLGLQRHLTTHCSEKRHN